jgi:hypothetical protein
MGAGSNIGSFSHDADFGPAGAVAGIGSVRICAQQRNNARDALTCRGRLEQHNRRVHAFY